METPASLPRGRAGLWAAAAVVLALALVALGGPAHAAAYRVIGYATQWNPVQDDDVGKIDTLIFAFATVRDGRVVLAKDTTARLQTMVRLKDRDPSLRVSIAVGGWGAGGFSEAAATAKGRALFADSAAELIASRHADGLDIDWEYPGNDDAGIHASSDDKANFVLLLKAVRSALDRVGAAHGRTGADHYTLSVAVADGPFADGVDIPAVAREVDWFNLMTYDFCNVMTPETCHHAGLHPSRFAPADARTTDRAVQQYLAAGVPPHKLVIGVAFYGREFTGVDPLHDGLYRPYEKFVRTIAWPELKAGFIDKDGFARHWDAQAQAAWLWNTKSHTFITYDDPESIAAKAAYVKAYRLGGIMYWEQSLDPDGELLDAVRRGLR